MRKQELWSFVVVAVVISAGFVGFVHQLGQGQEPPPSKTTGAIRRRPPSIFLSRRASEDYFVVCHRVKGGETLSGILDSHRRDFEISNNEMVSEAASLMLKEPGARSSWPEAVCANDLVPVVMFSYDDLHQLADKVVFQPSCDEVYSVRLRPSLIDWASRKKAQVIGLNLK